ncbi:ANTAR domain-containing protein [Thiomicrorhabdus sp. zzn3]|uniref:ANTAR domain-containing response regulator n=1 Tax=Thiomicrorhabdus sp. zzn3 TaxID=3039775 RepID=UPI002436E5D9|nr:ANTAR domain-containing protein [Thiomicrorhabdus sp. zzn3]MDG6778370.1 ANTAR domain-containing protein [Thiomicrorhabdus sp. zzn3]
MELKVLLVCDDVLPCQELQQGLERSGIGQVERIGVKDNLLKAIADLEVDLIIVDVEKPTLNLFEQFAVVHEYCPKPVICFSGERDTHIIAQSVKAGITAYIVDGKDADRMQPIIEVAMARFKQCQALKKELIQVKDKLSERAVIERAKGLLIEYKHMSEDQAYKTMRKMAMDQGKKISVIAHEICDVIKALSA